jgi:hypothetical protein
MRVACRMSVVASLLCLASISAIVAGYHRVSHAYDEPAHIACGLEWLDHGTYTLEPLHPPLARVAVALGSFLAGSHLPPLRIARNAGGESYDIFGIGDGSYAHTLALARVGELPFFALGASIATARADHAE